MSNPTNKPKKPKKKQTQVTTTEERFVFFGAKVMDELRILLRLAAPSRR